jgi:hypothetical protein
VQPIKTMDESNTIRIDIFFMTLTLLSLNGFDYFPK